MSDTPYRFHLTGYDRDGKRVNRWYKTDEACKRRTKKMDWVSIRALGIYVIDSSALKDGILELIP